MLSTGYKNMREVIVKVFGEDVVGTTSIVNGLDEEGEVRGLFRPSGHPGVRLFCYLESHADCWLGGFLVLVHRWRPHSDALSVKATGAFARDAHIWFCCSNQDVGHANYSTGPWPESHCIV